MVKYELEAGTSSRQDHTCWKWGFEKIDRKYKKQLSKKRAGLVKDVKQGSTLVAQAYVGNNPTRVVAMRIKSKTLGIQKLRSQRRLHTSSWLLW